LNFSRAPPWGIYNRCKLGSLKPLVTHIPAKTIEVDDLQAEAMLITTNRFQHPLQQIEEAWAVQDLIENHKKSLRECGNILDVSKSWVYHRQLLATIKCMGLSRPICKVC